MNLTKTSKNPEKTNNLLVGDFETRAGVKAMVENETWVWAWALCKIDKALEPIVGNSIDTFFSKLETMGNSTVYFHNLKFDGNFILSWLYRNGFEYAEERDEDGKKVKLLARQFSTIIGDEGQFYSIKVCIRRGCTIKFLDSYKKLPFAVEKIAKDFKTKNKKLDIDYNLERKPGWAITEDEKVYIENDVKIVAEAMYETLLQGHTKLTIGSDCLQEYKNLLGGNAKFREKFPILSEAEDAFVRKSYRGGYCYLHRPGRYKNGITVDANSHYPSSMHSDSGNMYPYGEGVYYKGGYIQDDDYPLWVGRGIFEFEIKDNHLPCIQLKKNFRYKENEYIRESLEPVEMTITSVDWAIMNEQYNFTSVEWIDGYKYHGALGMFDVYIDKYMNIKMEAEGALRALAKLFLNNLYGKFAQAKEAGHKIPLYDKDIDLVKYKVVLDDARDGVYVPVGTFCTAYARATTVRLGQLNYDRVIYFDTDSMHLMGHDDPAGVPIHDSALCHWKVESHWDDAIFLRQKTYMEHMPDGKYDNPWYDQRPGDMGLENKEKKGPHWEIKCAGMDWETKAFFLRGIDTGDYKPEDFDYGLKIEGYKLKQTVVKGGVILKPDKFEIRLPD